MRDDFMTLPLFWGDGEKHYSEVDIFFNTVDKICTMEMYYAALTNSHLKT